MPQPLLFLVRPSGDFYAAQPTPANHAMSRPRTATCLMQPVKGPSTRLKYNPTRHSKSNPLETLEGICGRVTLSQRGGLAPFKVLNAASHVG